MKSQPTPESEASILANVLELTFGSASRFLSMLLCGEVAMRSRVSAEVDLHALTVRQFLDDGAIAFPNGAEADTLVPVTQLILQRLPVAIAGELAALQAPLELPDLGIPDLVGNKYDGELKAGVELLLADLLDVPMARAILNPVDEHGFIGGHLWNGPAEAVDELFQDEVDDERLHSSALVVDGVPLTGFPGQKLYVWASEHEEAQPLQVWDYDAVVEDAAGQRTAIVGVRLVRVLRWTDMHAAVEQLVDIDDEGANFASVLTFMDEQRDGFSRSRHEGYVVLHTFETRQDLVHQTSPKGLGGIAGAALRGIFEELETFHEFPLSEFIMTAEPPQFAVPTKGDFPVQIRDEMLNAMQPLIGFLHTEKPFQYVPGLEDAELIVVSGDPRARGGRRHLEDLVESMHEDVANGISEWLAPPRDTGVPIVCLRTEVESVLE